MRNFVVQRNIERYHKQLEFETDEGRRQMLLVLLAEEEAKDLVAHVKPDSSRSN
jgi:hypothetical protein